MIAASVAVGVVGLAACYAAQRVALAWISMRAAERSHADDLERIRADVAKLREDYRELATGARSRVRA